MRVDDQGNNITRFVDENCNFGVNGISCFRIQNCFTILKFNNFLSTIQLYLGMDRIMLNRIAAESGL